MLAALGAGLVPASFVMVLGQSPFDLMEVLLSKSGSKVGTCVSGMATDANEDCCC